MSISPEVVRQLVSDIEVWPVLSRGVEKIAVTNTLEMYTVLLPLSLLHKVKIHKNCKTYFSEHFRLINSQMDSLLSTEVVYLNTLLCCS